MRSCPIAERCGRSDCAGRETRDDPPELETRLYCLTGDCENCPLLAEAALLTGGTLSEPVRSRNGHSPAMGRPRKRATDEPDLVLVEKAQAGDDDAYEELMARHRRGVWRYAHRILNDAEEALDVTQEVFARVYRKLDAFDVAKARCAARHAVAAWLLTIAHHAAHDRLRWLNRRPTEPLSALLAAPPLTDSDVIHEANAHEIGEQIDRALEQLPAPQRTALELCERDGFSYDEAATAMHCSIKSIEMRLYRAKQLLRRRLRLTFA